MQRFSTGELARRCGVNVETVRYYTRRGLMAEPARNAAGHRRYTAGDVRRLDFVKRCQALGFSLEEIREILELRVAPGSSCADMQARVGRKLAAVSEKVRELERIRDALARLQARCTGRGPIGDCPILEILDDAAGDAGLPPPAAGESAAGAAGRETKPTRR